MKDSWVHFIGEMHPEIDMYRARNFGPPTQGECE